MLSDFEMELEFPDLSIEAGLQIPTDDRSICSTIYKFTEEIENPFADYFAPPWAKQARAAAEPAGTQHAADVMPIAFVQRARIGRQQLKQGALSKRFTLQQRLVLNDWFNAHASHPFLLDDDIAELKAATGLSKRQLQVYFTNKRTRAKRTVM